MKRIFYLILAITSSALVFMTAKTVSGQPCPAGQPCPVAAPCPCPANTPCPCQNPASSELAISDALKSQACFKIFSMLLQQGDMAKILRGKGPYTVFAPTDEAFAKLPQGTVESLLCPQNRCKLEKLLRYHVINEAVACSEFTCAKTIRTSEGECLTIQPQGDRLVINSTAQILQGDICTKNGKIYTIDKVLMPQK